MKLFGFYSIANSYLKRYHYFIATTMEEAIEMAKIKQEEHNKNETRPAYQLEFTFDHKTFKPMCFNLKPGYVEKL